MKEVALGFSRELEEVEEAGYVFGESQSRT
jgi:hypothetical protein